jgi:glycosyltransferase involved in cell wall biosynthesis
LAQEEPQHRGKVELTRHGVLAVPSIVPKVGVASRIALFLGRLEAYKGLDVLAHAAKELEAERPDVRFRVVGSGSELSNVLRAAKALTNLDVTAGYFSPDDAVRELQGAALVVAPYKDATQSGIVAAAFANGRPVVASKVGGLPEMIVDGVNGRLIPPEDPKSLARAVSELLSDSQALEAMSTAAARTAETALAWNGIAADTYQKYRVLASARQGSRN